MKQHSFGRFLSMILLLAMLLSLSLTAFADDTGASDSSNTTTSETEEQEESTIPDYDYGYDSEYEAHEHEIIVKCMGYRIAGGTVARGAKADIELAIYDSDFTYTKPGFLSSSNNSSGTLFVSHGNVPRKMFITLGDCGFSQSPDDSAASYITYDNELGCLLIHIIGCEYNGTGNTLVAEVGYTTGGRIRNKTFTVTITEAPGGESSSSVTLAPTLLVDSYTVTPEGGAEVLYAGTPFTLDFSLFNTSRSVAVQNMRVQVKGGEVFSQTSGTDTIYIEKLAPQSASSQSVPFLTPSDANPGSYPIVLELSYESIDGGVKQNGSDTITLHLPLAQLDRIRCSRAAIDPGFVGSELILNYSFINAGFTTLYNAEVQVYNAMDELIASKYVGTVEPAKEIKGSDIGLIFYEVGEQAVRVVLQYQNSEMETLTVEETTTVFVDEYYEPVWDEPILDDPMLEEPAADYTLWIILGVAAVVVTAGVVVLVICIKRSKAKKLHALEAYDDEDL